MHMNGGYRDQAACLQRHMLIAPFRDRLAAMGGVAADDDLCAAIIEQAARFAESELDGLGAALDRNGAQLVNGKVKTCAEQGIAWSAFRDAGWLSLAAVEPYGQGLPTHLVVACEELFNRASAAFYMLPTATRCGASLLIECADEGTRDAWVPRLLAGDWTATICISEPDAGSDVGRIRTTGVFGRGGDQRWTVSGEKCWISFGDHDLVSRIGHLMLARTSRTPGVRGLSLFLVPSTRDDGTSNGVSVRRIEEKLGLHGSPTCVLGFEEAEAILIGDEGRGLQQMFHMMLQMRLACGPQGTGVAAAALDIALGYAAERKQGGLPDQPPVPISEHADIQRQLLEMAASVEMSRALNVACAQVLDLAAASANEADCSCFGDLAQFLLPIVKDGAAWAAFDVASQGIQVLGGAGYTTEWPLERLLREARVFPVFEGTTGIQALDMVHRRLWKDKRAGLAAFIAYAREEAALANGRKELCQVLDLLEQTADQLCGMESNPRAAEGGAVAWLESCKLAVYGWLATRMVRLAGSDAVGTRLKAVAEFFLSEVEPRAQLAAKLALRGEIDLTQFNALKMA